jgi:hypothetical protein
MTTDADNVRVAITGAVSYAEYGTSGMTAPTGTADAIAPRVDVGYISEDGVTLSFPSSGDKTNLKAWQNGATVRTLRTKSDDLPQFHCVLLETRKEVIELTFGDVTQTSTEGSYDYDANADHTPKDMIVDVIDGDELLRNHLPKAVLAQIGDLVYKNAEPIGYEVTFDLERDSTAGYNMRTWATALKTGA